MWAVCSPWCYSEIAKKHKKFVFRKHNNFRKIFLILKASFFNVRQRLKVDKNRRIDYGGAVGGSLGFHMVGTGWRRLPLGQP
jgi:hypothetical protein